MCLHVLHAGYGGKRPFNYFVFGAAVSEVELDTLTGESLIGCLTGCTLLDFHHGKFIQGIA
jgi:xanthine dehydrogenase molybdopterin-binding subunit B